MSVATTAPITSDILSADSNSGQTGAGELLAEEHGFGGLGFDFALKKNQPKRVTTPEANLDRLIEQLQNHAQNPEAIRQAAGALRNTVETSLWQSAQRNHSRLPLIHAELLGKATGLFLAHRLCWLGGKLREWLVILSSPKRLFWAVQAAWRGEDVADQVREKAEWHRVDEIAVFQRHIQTPLLRVGSQVPADEDDWIASNPILGVTRRHLDGKDSVDCSHISSEEDEVPVQSLVVVGERCEITARVTGHPPPGFREELQTLCAATDAVLVESGLSRAEWVLRIKKIVSPALTKTGPHVAERFWNPLVILAVFLTAGAAILGGAGVEHLRWQGVVSQLDLEPGIEVLSSSSTFGHRRVEILRDPLAKDVGKMLRSIGIDPSSVAVTERPFISADAEMVAMREQSQTSYARHITNETINAKAKLALPSQPGATDRPPNSPADISQQVLADVRLDLLRSVLELPADLEMSLSAGQLVAKGALSEPAYSRLASAPSKMVWLKNIDLSQVRDVTAENITALQDGLEKTHVEFVPASAILPEASKLRLQSIASDMLLMAADARLKRQTVKVQFCASHPTMDASTVAIRVESIRKELVRLGAPEAWFDHSLGLLDASGPGTVSFKINLESPASAP